jgi:NOL1/NOP2/sun family putative RNA methylase
MNIFEKRYKEFGGDIKQVHPQKAIHVNTLKISSGELQKRLEKRGVKLQKIPFVDDGFFVQKTQHNLVSMPEYLLGMFYIQDAASQIPVYLMNPIKSVVLDACAAPGGKTVQLAAVADAVVAIDVDAERFKKLEHNLERMGIRNCLAYNMNILHVRKTFRSILLDAPCSGNYTLEPKWFEKTTLKRIHERAENQKILISHLLTLLERQGVLIYSTCSLEPEENEGVIQHALDQCAVKLEPIHTIGDPGLQNALGRTFDDTMKYCRRLWPSKTNTIGFFVARLRKC